MNNFLLVLSVTVSSLAHIFLKFGAKDFGIQTNLISTIKMNLLNWGLVGGISLHMIALIIWVSALKRVDISYAYPFLSLGYVFIAVLSYFFLGESITPVRITGMFFIILGILIIAR